jgi:hypothetical protein
MQEGGSWMRAPRESRAAVAPSLPHSAAVEGDKGSALYRCDLVQCIVEQVDPFLHMRRVALRIRRKGDEAASHSRAKEAADEPAGRAIRAGSCMHASCGERGMLLSAGQERIVYELGTTAGRVARCACVSPAPKHGRLCLAMRSQPARTAVFDFLALVIYFHFGRSQHV